MKELHKLDTKKRVYDIETESYHVHNNLYKVKLFVQDVIKHFNNPMFMNKKSADFEEITDESRELIRYPAVVQVT